MNIKRVLPATICALLLFTGIPTARAQGGNNQVSGAKIRKHSRLTRPKRRATNQPIPVVLSVRDEYTDRQIIKGEIISVSADHFTVRDARGMDTVVYLFPDTDYRIETSSGALKKGGVKMIRRVLLVEVDGLLNFSYQMKATVITTTEAGLKAAQAIQSILPPEREP
jgi:hypothetical protein